MTGAARARAMLRLATVAAALAGCAAQVAAAASADAVDCPASARQADDVRETDCEQAWRRQVQDQAQAGDAAGGIATLTRLIGLNPDGQYFTLRGRLEASLGQAAAARADLDEGVRRRPEQPDTWLTRAFFLRDQQDFANAQADLDRAMTLRAPDVHTEVLRTELDISLGRFRAGVRDAEEALRLDPGYLGAVRWHVTALVYAGDYDAAMVALREAHAIDPLDADTRMFGAIQFMQGRYTESAATWASAKGDPTNAAYYPLWRYLALRRTASAAEAAELLSAVPQGMWPGPVAQLYRGRIDAYALMAAAIEARKQEPGAQECEAWFYAGEAELDAGHIAETFDLLRQAVAQCPLQLTERKLAVAELRRLGFVH
jgi:lipoprotein NlpI